MLPSSHDGFINYDPAGDRPGGRDLPLIPEGSKFGIGKSGGRTDESAVLANAFTQFVTASVRLEDSYRQLQKDVLDLRMQLSERDCALLDSLAENERIRESLQQILDSMPCGVLVINEKGQAVLMNPESRRLLGLPLTQDKNSKAPDLEEICRASGIPPECLNPGAEDSESIQNLYLRNAAEPRWLELRKRRLLLRTVGGRDSDQTILVIRDITAQRRAEEEREAGRNAVALAETMSIIAHEIRNPLASLELFSELIETDSERRSEWIANLRAGIRTLGGTVNNVLNLRLGDLQMSPMNLPDAIQHALEFVKPIAQQAGIKIEVTGETEPHQLVMLNESAVQQLVLNLVSNATRNTPSGGTISVSYKVDGAPDAKKSRAGAEQIVVEVADNGSGIRADQIDRIFEAGFSGSGETPGLGLAVCDRVMRMHGGGISVRNIKPSGAQFTLQFPAVQSRVA